MLSFSNSGKETISHRYKISKFVEENVPQLYLFIAWDFYDNDVVVAYLPRFIESIDSTANSYLVFATMNGNIGHSGYNSQGT